MSPLQRTVLAIAIVFGNHALARADPLVVGGEARTGLGLTIFESGFAVVADRRRADIPSGPSEIRFDDVAAGMRPETARVSGDGLTVRAQVFDNDVLTLDRLAAAHVGKNVGLKRTDARNGGKKIVPAKIIAARDGRMAVEVENRIEWDYVENLVVDRIPGNLAIKPALIAGVFNPQARKNLELKLLYMTNDLTWSADYVANLNAEDTEMDLSVWATVVNNGETDFPNAELALLSGDVHRTAPKMAPRGTMRAETAMMANAEPAPGIDREALSGYHLYKVDEPHRIGPRQSRRIALIKAPAVAIEIEHVISGQVSNIHGRREGVVRGKAMRRVVFANDAASRLGLPLPAGVVRFYRGDTFIGEDRLNHLAKGTRSEPTLGRDSDIGYERTQTDYVRHDNRLIETAHRISVANGSERAMTVRVEEPMTGEWEILKESLRHAKATAHRADWKLEIPAGGTRELTYRVRTRF